MTVISTYRASYADIDRKGHTSSSLLAVWTRNAMGRDTVYLAICTLPDASHRLYGKTLGIKADRIAASGAKAKFELAKVYFPDLERKNYCD